MSRTMHDILASAVEVRERSLSQSASFAAGHGTTVRRSIRARRLGTYAGTGSVAAVAAVSAGLGLKAWAESSSTLTPGGGPSGDPSYVGEPSTSPSPSPQPTGTSSPQVDTAPSSSLTWTSPSVATPVTVLLVAVPLDESTYPADEPSRSYVYYATLGQAEMVTFPASGLYYPGIPDVPADAFIVSVSGDVDGYDLDAPGGVPDNISGFSMVSDEGDLVGDRSHYRFEYTADGQNASITWDVFGHVSSTTQWGVRYYLVDGRLVTELEGRANPDAIEVTATFDPATAG